jgi:hypothetical protein
MVVPAGVDPRMFAYLAHRQLQHGQQQQHHQNHQNQQHQHHQHHQQQQQQQQQQPGNGQIPQQQQQQHQRPGGDASAVASCLLQLKTNQYGEPVSDAEALQIQQQHQHQHHAALNAAARSGQLPQMPGHHQQAAVVVPGGYPHHPHHGVAIPGMSAIYHGYPGMVPFPPAPNGNFAVAAATAVAMQQVGVGVPGQGGVGYPQMHHQVMQQHQQHHHPEGSLNSVVQGLAPMPGGIPGMKHSPQQLGGAGILGVPPGNSGPTDGGPIMTEAYIESLITDDKNNNKNNNKNHNQPNNDIAKIENGSTIISALTETTPADGSISAKDDMYIALVVAKDRDLIPDALFVALGQMKPCVLQQSDRVGCYKTRTLGFLGMSCKVRTEYNSQ